MTSVVSRIGIASTSSGSSIVATVVPAVVQLAASPSAASTKPSTWLPGVAHEDGGAAPGAQVERQEAEAGEAEREREHEHEVVLVHASAASTAKYGARDGRERRREPVHVVEQVEGVRDPDEPDEGDDDPRCTSFAISSTRRPAAITIPAAANWATSFAIGLR